MCFKTGGLVLLCFIIVIILSINRLLIMGWPNA
jgi:hypothetical protein